MNEEGSLPIEIARNAGTSESREIIKASINHLWNDKELLEEWRTKIEKLALLRNHLEMHQIDNFNKLKQLSPNNTGNNNANQSNPAASSNSQSLNNSRSSSPPHANLSHGVSHTPTGTIEYMMSPNAISLPISAQQQHTAATPAANHNEYPNQRNPQQVSIQLLS